MVRVKPRAAQRTFSSEPGQRLWLPGSVLALRLFPSHWEILDASNPDTPQVGYCDLQAIPAGLFVAQTDWLKGQIQIRLQCESDVQIWRLSPLGPRGVAIVLERAKHPAPLRLKGVNGEQMPVLAPREQVQGRLLGDGELLWEVGGESPMPPDQPQTQLYFGSHKAAQWSRIDQRVDLTQIGPIVQLAGQWAERALEPLDEGVVRRGQDALDSCGLSYSDERFPKALLRGWRAHFGRWALPHWRDPDQRGWDPIWQQRASCLYHYIAWRRWLIERLWRPTEGGLRLLPAPPSACHAGRVLNASAPFGAFDLFWSKRRLAGLLIRCRRSGQFTLGFPKAAHQVRLRRSDRKLGVHLPLNPAGELSVVLESGKVYHLDRLRG